MEMPPQWRIEKTAEFKDDYARLAEFALRLDDVVESLEFYLARRPERISSGLTSANDTDRAVAWTDTDGDGAEYVVGFTVEAETRTVRLRWVQVLEVSEES